MSRRRIIAGNWKMNKTPSEAVALVNELLPLVKNDDVDVVFCVPAIDIVPVVHISGSGSTLDGTHRSRSIQTNLCPRLQRQCLRFIF